MAPITLICLVKGDSPVNAFAVDIDDSKLVSHLKRSIKMKKAPDFSNFASDKLKLWKVEIRDDKLTKLPLRKRDELLATRDIKEYWTESPPKRHIHVIVSPPTIATAKKRKEATDKTRSSSKGTLQETPAKSLRQTRTRKELRLEGILNELSVDVMEDVIMSDGTSTSSRIPSESFHHLCQKFCRSETQTISCYFEFGKALKNQLDDFIEKKHVDAREMLIEEVFGNFPAGTSHDFVKKKMEKARKIYDLFSVIGENKIQRVRSFSAEAISVLTKDEIGYIKGKFS